MRLVLVAVPLLLIPLGLFAMAGRAPGRAAPIAIPDSDAAALDGWERSWRRATARATEERRPLLVLFTGSDWCSWCQRLEGEVLGTPAFTAWAGRRVVPVRLDFPMRTAQDGALTAQNEALREAWRVRGFPTVVLLDHEGRELGRLGYRPGGVDAWIAAAEEALGGG